MQNNQLYSTLLKQIDENSSEIFETAPCGYLFCDLDGNIVKINRTLSKLTGFQADEIVNKKRFRDLLTIGSKIHYETNFDPLLRLQGFLNEIALDLLNKDRKSVPVLLNSVAIKNNLDIPLGFQTTLFNISDRRAYERELLRSKIKAEESELRFRFLASAGKLLQGSHGNTAGFNELSAIAVEGFCDACAIDLWEGQKFNRVSEAYRGQGKTIPAISGDHSVKILNSVNRIHDLHATSMDENKNTLPWINAFKDYLPESIITAPILLFESPVGVITFLMIEVGRKFKAEDQDLAVEIARRLSLAIETSRLESEKSETLLKLKEERDLREKFVATLTHDLRTPITSIKMSAQLIRTKSEREEIKQLSSRVIKSVDRADSMIQDLLDANSLTVGQSIPMEFSQCDLSVVISETLFDLNLSHPGRFALGECKPQVIVASPPGIRRVLENLCNNAVKYGSSESKVEISLREETASVVISVHNFGNSISENDQAVIFDVYKRTQSAALGGQKGWGLGLALVKAVAEAHGGYAFVSSTPDAGTTFSVSLPKQRAI